MTKETNHRNKGIMFAASSVAVATLLGAAVASMPAMAVEPTGHTASVSQTASKGKTRASSQAVMAVDAAGLNAAEMKWLQDNKDTVGTMIPGFDPTVTDYYDVPKDKIESAAGLIPMAGVALGSAPITVDSSKSGYLVDGKVSQTAPSSGDVSYQVAIKGKQSGNTVLYTAHTAAKPSNPTLKGDVNKDGKYTADDLKDVTVTIVKDGKDTPLDGWDATKTDYTVPSKATIRFDKLPEGWTSSSDQSADGKGLLTVTSPDGKTSFKYVFTPEQPTDPDKGDNNGTTDPDKGDNNGTTDPDKGDNNGNKPDTGNKDDGKPDTTTKLDADETKYLTDNKDKVSTMIPGFDPTTTDYYGVSKDVITKTAGLIPMANTALGSAPIEVDTANSGYLVNGKVTQTAPTSGDITYQVAIKGKTSGKTVLYTLHTAAKPAGDTTKPAVKPLSIDLSKNKTSGHGVYATSGDAKPKGDKATDPLYGAWDTLKPGTYTITYRQAGDGGEFAQAVGFTHNENATVDPKTGLIDLGTAVKGDSVLNVKDPSATSDTADPVSATVTLKEGDVLLFPSSKTYTFGTVTFTTQGSQTPGQDQNQNNDGQDQNQQGGDQNQNGGDQNANNADNTQKNGNGILAQTGLNAGLIGGIMAMLTAIGGVLFARRKHAER